MCGWNESKGELKDDGCHKRAQIITQAGVPS